MAKNTGIVLTSSISESKAQRLLRKIKEGKKVSARERLDVITDILAFSPRDWSTDKELWLLYRIAFNDGTEKE
ncbi:hypothetical protein A3B01_02300 [Candidatus Nomurabacteria bacterium RIFCSPLOWO2_01_FULL_41_52b]|nr:MAG: hypothetical protein A3B01_02300 [Candidatus Nomurabacteria bacterium RIFCSPLOWO2_01_FULL_41_52b]